MTQNFKPLEPQRLNRRMSYHQPIESNDTKVSMDSPAYSVMTDLTRVEAVTIGPHESLFQANRRMITMGVRLLMVVDNDNQVMGLITTTDINSEKPLSVVKEKSTNYNALQVDDIMIHYDKLEVLFWRDVVSAKVGDIAETLKRVGRRHAIVVDGEEDAQIIRGIFSSSQLARATGEEVDTSAKTANFAALKHALMHGKA
jgi:signal-transduction protein with cAMP-binding, CBS, and nucleotidyltransferase domain